MSPVKEFEKIPLLFAHDPTKAEILEEIHILARETIEVIRQE